MVKDGWLFTRNNMLLQIVSDSPLIIYSNDAQPNGPYSLLVRAFYFIYYSVYARSTSVILSFANGAGGVGVF